MNSADGLSFWPPVWRHNCERCRENHSGAPDGFRKDPAEWHNDRRVPAVIGERPYQKPPPVALAVHSAWQLLYPADWPDCAAEPGGSGGEWYR